MDQRSACAFCEVDRGRELFGGECAFAILDAYPVSEGHCLVIPRRHVVSWFETTAAEREEMLALLDRVRRLVEERHAPAGFNVGINDGAAAGQTVPHVHIHLIPRYTGDVADPRGGVRWVIPGRGDYWTRR